ncbi:MAG: T9SS type A sorting domain-containing protein, partial [Candidatus Kapaibacterium sp.]
NGWYRIDADHEFEELNDLLLYNDSLLIAVGDLGTVRRSVRYGADFKVTHGYFMQPDLNAIVSAGEVLFACGDNGCMIWSDDLGISWTEIDLGVNANLTDICFSGDMGYIIGSDGTIIYSNDSGNNWQALDLNIFENLNDAEFLDENTLLIAGDAGAFFKINTGDNSFEKIDLNTTSDLNCLTTLEGRYILTGGENSTLIRSDDGLQNFRKITSESLPKKCTELEFVSRDTILGGCATVISPNKQCFSTDGGESWVYNIKGSTPNNSYAIDTEHQSAYVAGINGYVAAINLNTDLKKSQQFPGYLTTFPVHDYTIRHFSVNQNYFIINNQKSILISKDSCQNFSTAYSVTGALNIIDALPVDEHILALEDSTYYYEYNGSQRQGHVAFITRIDSDGNIISRRILDEKLSHEHLLKANDGYIISYSDFAPYFYLSRDQGNSWAIINSPDSIPIYEMTILCEDILYIFSKDNDKYYIAKSYDSGENWDIGLTAELNHFATQFRFIDEMTGYAFYTDMTASRHKVHKTTDGGDSWNQILDSQGGNGNYFLDMDFIDTDHGIIVRTDCTALITTDGGTSWSEEIFYNSRNSIGLAHILFRDSSYIYIATDHDIFRKKNDIIMSVGEDDALTPFILFPNPTSDFITISGINAPTQKIDIYTLAGVNIMSAEGPRVDVSHLAPGFYFVRVGDKSLKFVKM